MRCRYFQRDVLVGWRSLSSQRAPSNSYTTILNKGLRPDLGRFWNPSQVASSQRQWLSAAEMALGTGPGEGLTTQIAGSLARSWAPRLVKSHSCPFLLNFNSAKVGSG